EHGVPQLEMILKEINPRTRQRSLRIQIAFPLLSTDFFPVRVVDRKVVWDRKHEPPTVETPPVITTEVSV
nr:hypothetical protein [Tanacetum cinerariifolium]